MHTKRHLAARMVKQPGGSAQKTAHAAGLPLLKSANCNCSFIRCRIGALLVFRIHGAYMPLPVSASRLSPLPLQKKRRYDSVDSRMKCKRSVSMLLASLPFVCTGCTSFSGEKLGAAYMVLLWIGGIAGYLISDFIWSGDDAGNEYTPVWEVIAWFFFTALGIVLGYIKPFFLFSGFLISVMTPVAAMTAIMLIVRVLRKRRKN